MATKPIDGRFSLSYFLFGGGLADWLRPLGDDWRRLVIYGVVGCIVYVIITHFFPAKPQGNVNRPEANQSVTVMPFADVKQPITQTSTSTNTQKVENPKRSWWKPIPFVQIYAGGRSKDTSSFNVEPEYGANAGLRWDFD